MDPQSAMQLLGPPPDAQPTTQDAIPARLLAPQTAAALEDSSTTPIAAMERLNRALAGGAVSNVSQNIPGVGPSAPSEFTPRTALEDYTQRNRQPGVPFDPSDEIGHWTALMAELRRDKAEKIKFLANTFGPENVRADDRGDPIIRVTDPETKKPKDIPLNAWGMSVNDLMTLAAATPQAAGAMVGISGGAKALETASKGAGAVARVAGAVSKAKGAKGFLRDVTAASIGGEAAVGAQDIATRAYDQMPLEISKEIKDRALQVPVDMVADYALAGLSKPLQWIKRGLEGNFGIASPLSMFRKKIQNDAIAATEFIKAKTGADIPLPVSESSGIPFLAKLYEYNYRHPAGAGPILKERELVDQGKKAFQEYMMQPATLLDDETIGRRVVGELDKLAQNSEAAVKREAATTESNITGQILGTAKGISSAGPQPSFADVGQSIRSKIITSRDAAKAEQNALREQIAQLPGGTGKVFESGPIGLQASAEKQLKALPSPEETITVPSGLVNQAGQPLMVTKTGKVLEKEFVPDHVVKRLQSLTKEKKYSLSDLIQMRSDVYEDIAAGQAVPNTGTHYLNEIGKMLTGAIENGINKLPTGDLKTLLTQANLQYKTKVVPFESSGISRLFKGLTEPGFVENTEIVSSLMRDADKYTRTVQFLGQNSPEHQKLKRAVFDQLMMDSADDLEGKLLNPEALVKNITSMARDQKTKAIFQDVFGNKANSLIEQAQTLSTAKALKTGKISKEDLELILAKRSPGSFDLQNLAQAHLERVRTYDNQVIKKLVNGTLSPEKINPEDFISKFLDSGSYSDVAQAWGHLSTAPDLQDQVKRKLIERVFKRAARSPEPADIAAKLSGDKTHVVTSEGLERALGDEMAQKKLSLIVGQEPMQLLKAMTSRQAAEDWARQEAGATGIFASGNAVGGVMRMKVSPSGLTHELVDLARYKIASILLTAPGLKRLLNSTYTPKEIPSLVRAIVVSEPFARAALEDYKDHYQAYQMLSASKRFAGLVVPDQQAQQPAQP